MNKIIKAMVLIAMSIYCYFFDVLTKAYVRLSGLTPLDTGSLPVDDTLSGITVGAQSSALRTTPYATNSAKRAKTEVVAVRTGTVNFYIYSKESYSIALDSGFGVPVIKRELASVGIDPDRISAVLLSHSDFDHTGGLSLFKNAAVYLSRDEEQMIMKRTSRKFGILYNGRIKKTYALLRDNQEITVGPIRVRAIETPGHTAGAMSFILDGSILFSGDAFRLIDGKVQPLDKLFNMDQEAHIESIKKLAQLENIKLVLTGHRGYCDVFDDAIKHWREI